MCRGRRVSENPGRSDRWGKAFIDHLIRVIDRVLYRLGSKNIEFATRESEVRHGGAVTDVNCEKISRFIVLGPVFLRLCFPFLPVVALICLKFRFYVIYRSYVASRQLHVSRLCLSSVQEDLRQHLWWYSYRCVTPHVPKPWWFSYTQIWHRSKETVWVS
jgi:hypothetical protein